jgi:hypothetical protein
MRRRLDRDGEKRLADWLEHYKPLGQTRRLIAEALEAYAEDENQIRFHTEIDPSNPSELVISPDEGLHLWVLPLGGEQFTLIRVIDWRGWTGD